MKTYKCDDIGHTIMVENPDQYGRYLVHFYEDGVELGIPEYYSKDCAEWKYEIEIDF